MYGLRGVGCDQLHLSMEQLFKIEHKLHKIIKGRLIKLDHYVYITAILFFSPSKRAEQAYSLNAKSLARALSGYQ